MAGVRQAHGVVTAVEQSHSERLLEPHDSLGERLLGQIEPFGGPAEVELIDDRDERPDLADVEVHPLSTPLPRRSAAGARASR